MNNCPGRGRGTRQPWPQRARAAAVITVMAPAALLAAACGGSPSPTSSGGSPNTGGPANAPIPVAYSQCMRSHGIAGFPDPDGNGQIPKQAIIQLGVSGSRLQAAQRACMRLWPYQPPSQAQQRQLLGDDLKFAQCMRSHGVPGFPDPTLASRGPIFAKAHGCQHVLPAGSSLPSVTVSP
jgi:hypothetical protein